MIVQGFCVCVTAAVLVVVEDECVDTLYALLSDVTLLAAPLLHLLTHRRDAAGVVGRATNYAARAG